MGIADKRQLLLDIGERLFSQVGYKDVNIEEISREAGVSTGGFYKFFPSKEHFYNEILDRIEAKGILEADRIVSKFNSPKFKLKALYRFSTLGIRRNKLLRGILTGDRKYNFPGSEQRLRRKNSLKIHIEKMIYHIINEGNDKRIFRSGLYKNPQVLLVSVYDAVLQQMDQTNIEDLMDDVLKLLERGLERRLRLRKKGERRDKRTGKDNLYF
jgi:AcrR family transcriptional regulator